MGTMPGVFPHPNCPHLSGVWGATPQFAGTIVGGFLRPSSFLIETMGDIYPITLAAFCHWSPESRRLLLEISADRRNLWVLIFCKQSTYLLHLVTSKECLGMVGHDNFHWVTKLIVLNNIVHGLFTCLQTTMYKCITHCLEEPVWVWTLVSNSGAADEFWPRVSEVTATEKWEQFNLSGMICCYWLKIWRNHLLMPEVFQICLAARYQTQMCVKVWDL